MTAPHVRTPGEVGTNGRALKEEAASILAGAAPIDKRLANLEARFALRGFSLKQMPGGQFVIARWNLHRVLDHVDEVEAFAAQVGA